MRGVKLAAAAGALLCLAAAGAVWAQTGLPAPKPWAEPTKDPHDLNGVYMPERNSFEFTPVEGGDPPWTPEAHADFLRRRQGRGQEERGRISPPFTAPAQLTSGRRGGSNSL